MEDMHQFLCSHVSMDKIIVRAEVLKELLKKEKPDTCVEKEITPTLMCTICINSDDRTIITDYSQGLLIFLGVNGQGCGGIVGDGGHCSGIEVYVS